MTKKASGHRRINWPTCGFDECRNPATTSDEIGVTCCPDCGNALSHFHLCTAHPLALLTGGDIMTCDLGEKCPGRTLTPALAGAEFVPEQAPE